MLERVLVPNYEELDKATEVPKKDLQIAIQTLCKAQGLIVGARFLVGQIHQMEDCPSEVRTAIENFLKESAGFADPSDPTPWIRKTSTT